MKALGALRSKLLTPCKKLVLRVTFKLWKPLRLLRFRLRATKSSLTSLPTNPTFDPVSPCFHSRHQRRRKKINRVIELRRSVSSEDEKKLFPSPVTPSYIKAFRAARTDSRSGNQDASRSFEDYLAEMIVEEGRMKDDLTDLEELVHCWKNLKCPVFIDAVCRFYNELCKDLCASTDLREPLPSHGPTYLQA